MQLGLFINKGYRSSVLICLCAVFISISLLTANVLSSQISIRSYDRREENLLTNVDGNGLNEITSGPFLPILLMHGVTADNNSMSDVKKYLAKYVPQGTLIYSVPSTDTETSLLMNMMDQVEDFASKVKELQNLYKFNNFHLICHSQGGLICRSFIQLYPNHGVKVFISLSGVQNGQFGIPGILSWEQEWKKNFPFLWNLTKEEAYHFFYTDFFQKMMSVPGYWKDPFHFEEYTKQNQFLAVVNNDSLIHDYASKYQFRSNFLQIDKMVLTSSPDDEVIKPYYSAIFGFYALGNGNQLVPSQMTEQSIYRNDVFGLKTLDNEKRLIVHVVPGINHMLWIGSEQLVVKYMLPYLY